MKKALFTAIFLLFSTAVSALEYHSERLKLMDIEVLQQMISKNIRKLETKEESPEVVVKQSLEILLAQPDQSLASSNFFDQVRSLSGSDSVFIDALNQIVDEGISSLKQKGKNTDIQRDQNTYVYILNNMVGELTKYKDEARYKEVIAKIRDAKIKFNDHLVSYRLLNSMATAESPSKRAAEVLPSTRSWWKFWGD